MEWQRFALKALRHPKLKALKAFKYRKCCEFLALSCEFGRIGVVDLWDDEIRAELDMSMTQWLDLRDEMLVRGIIRQVERTDGEGHYYEVAFWLLPDQSATLLNGKKIVDSRKAEEWGEPEILSTEDNAADQPAAVGDITNADRQAWLRHRRKMLKAGQPEGSREEFIQQRHSGKPTQPQEDQNPTPTPTDPATEKDPVTGFFATHGVTHNGQNGATDSNGNGRAEQQEKENRDGKDNSRAEHSREGVTMGGSNGEKSPVTVDVAVVFSALRAEDIDATTAAALIAEHTAEVCAQQLTFWPDRKVDEIARGREEPGTGMLVRAIQGGWGPSKSFKARARRAGIEARDQARRERVAEKVREEESQADRRQAELDDFYDHLSTEEKAAIIEETEKNLPSIHKGKTGQIAQAMRAKERVKIIVLRMQEQAKKGQTNADPA